MNLGSKRLFGFLLLTVGVIIGSWMFLGPVSGSLNDDLGSPGFIIEWLEGSHAYLYLMILSLFFPLILSFDKKIHYISSWKYLLAVFLWISTLYIIWDVYFTRWQIWEFNGDYISGYRWWGLPLEEISFFLVVPFACLFIYECVVGYNLHRYVGGVVTPMMRIALGLAIALGVVYGGGYYSVSATVVLIIAMFYLERFLPTEQKSQIYTSLLLAYIPFLLVNGVLTGSCTQSPIVIYNDSENLPGRLGTIPWDDFIYQAGMFLWMVFIYSGAKKKQKTFYLF